ncbi:hypothetical protein K469DRAFT_708209 [Zopfia rhizophila CBS 207.26]|uniref:L domain-like protein n=1 Tax=Zopfia rhizophila CBS 207.26 TaxID=1314779 RepID=A0A6A6E383_9PEZI|nr:hypothetical protein K469DRAFT_708209 [Zopfia rhizophila CBS 207.26]
MDGETLLPSSPPLVARNLHSSPIPSSDPPMFSSDDAPEGLDNYEAPRSKRKRAGPWWGASQPATTEDPSAKKTKFTRNMDSGVWMNSDEAEEEQVDETWSNLSQFLTEADDTAANAFAVSKSSPFISAEGPDQHETTQMDDYIEARFYNTLREGVQANRTVYHFEHTQLQDHDIRDIDQLNAVIKEPLDPGTEAPGEEYYRSLTPELYVNLSSNFLKRLTPSLFTVANLTTLVLRDNDIEELPPQIGQLRNLIILDLSRNQLKWLPYEVLQLFPPYGKLTRLMLLGNPFLERVNRRRVRLADIHSLFGAVKTQDYAQRTRWLHDLARITTEAAGAGLLIKHLEGGGERSRETWLRNPTTAPDPNPGPMTVRYVGATPPFYFDHTGEPVRGSPRPPISDQDAFDVVVKTKSGVFGRPSTWYQPASRSRVLPLFSLSLHSVVTQLLPSEAKEMLGDDLPSEIKRGLSRAEDNLSSTYSSFRLCHHCGKPYVVVRAEWLEFWSIPGPEFIPFKGQVCSWGCVPEEYVSSP